MRILQRPTQQCSDQNHPSLRGHYQPTNYRLFSQCLIQKLPHLFGCNVLYHFDPNNSPPNWTDWDGPLTSTTNFIITKFLSGLIGTISIPHHALLIAQLNINVGGLGILDPRPVAIPDFMLSFLFARRHATSGTYVAPNMRTICYANRDSPNANFPAFLLVRIRGVPVCIQ